MLVVERRPGSSLHIGDSITVHVNTVRGSAVRLGISAPRDVLILRDELDDASETREGSGPNAARESAARDFTITIVEDDPAHAQLITLALANHGYTQVEHLARGAEALDVLGDDGVGRPPNLLLLDFRLPDLSGLQVVRSLRTTKSMRSTPIVMLSACSEPERVRECLGAGANAFVEKSPSFDELERSLRALTDFWAHQRVLAS